MLSAVGEQKMSGSGSLIMKVKILYNDKLQFYIEQMYAGQVFDGKQMKVWEKKFNTAKTIGNTKDYLKEIVDDNEMYTSNSSGMARKSGFDSAANVN